VGILSPEARASCGGGARKARRDMCIYCQGYIVWKRMRCHVFNCCYLLRCELDQCEVYALVRIYVHSIIWILKT